MKAIQEGALNQAFDPKKIMANTGPTKVVKSIQDARADAAMNAQSDKDYKLFEAGEAGDKRAMRQYGENVRRAGNKARRSVQNDFESGNLQQGEVESAQRKVATTTLQSLGQQGQINDQMMQSMVDTFNTLENQQRATNNVQQMLARIAAAQQGQKSVATKFAQNMQSQIGAQDW